jgi:hypothetical protein
MFRAKSADLPYKTKRANKTLSRGTGIKTSRRDLCIRQMNTDEVHRVILGKEAERALPRGCVTCRACDLAHPVGQER